MLLIRPNTRYSSSTIAFYYTLQRIWAVQISHHQVAVGHTFVFLFLYQTSTS